MRSRGRRWWLWRREKEEKKVRRRTDDGIMCDGGDAGEMDEGVKKEQARWERLLSSEREKRR